MNRFKMDLTVSKIRQNLDSIIQYIIPLLPVANCHMVEFITKNHWDRLLPKALTESFEGTDLNDAVEMFWSSAKGLKSGNNELDKWVQTSRSHHIQANNEYCLTREQFEDRIRVWGGDVKPTVEVTGFMKPKKSYEVQTMSSLVASLHSLYKTACCVEAGGGRGPLLAALSLAYRAHSLTVDCDTDAVNTALPRARKMQKLWHVIAKSPDGKPQHTHTANKDENLHRFVSAFVTKDTDLRAFVRESFPEFANGDIRLLLTGLHTCGNLGPDSLRIFSTQDHIPVLFNVPCCYHLLTEDSDEGTYDVFRKNFGNQAVGDAGFPMSEYLKGLSLGRNARMLASQSIDRVVDLKQIPAKSLFYRALLQELIKKHVPNADLSEGKLKRLSKCENFEEYFKMADSILKLDLYEKLTEDYWKDFLNETSGYWDNLVMFYLIRLCLAQVIESVILLDRLLYLYERGFERVFLVKLFNPVLSPRCHSIVALR